MNRKTIILFPLGILLRMCLVGAFSGFLLHGVAPSMKSPETNETVLSPSSITSPTTLSIPENATTSPIPVVNYTTVQQDIEGCPVILTHPPEEFTCPRDLPPGPETYHITDPLHPTQKEMDSIPVNFPGVDRTVLVKAVLKDPCVIEFLQSEGNIEGISDSPRPLLNGPETVRWPPVLYAYRRINCTEMLVMFEINPTAQNVSRFHIEFS